MKSLRIAFALGAGLIGASAWAQSTGTDFCTPGQNGTTNCPCNNPPAGTGKGCANFGPSTSGQSASLTATGTASVSADTLKFMATGTNDQVLCVFLQGTSSLQTGLTYGAGLMCIPIGGMKTLYHGNAGTGEPMGQITRPGASDPSVSTRSAALGDTITAGLTRFYMVGYRDKNAHLAGNCGSSQATKNSTQGVSIVWGP
jgi:hypothetical protein